MVEDIRINARSAARAVATAQLRLKEAAEGYGNERTILTAQAEGALEVAAERLLSVVTELERFGMPAKAGYARQASREHGTSL